MREMASIWQAKQEGAHHEDANAPFRGAKTSGDEV
jgi:hypothetical protein